MYRPSAFAVDDVTALHAVIRDRMFATMACAIDDKIEFGYAPVVLDANEGEFGAVRFHLAGNNPMAAIADGTTIAMSFLNAEAYVSPDWYETKGRVPTWNYIAVEGSGVAQRLDGHQLLQLLIDLSAQEESKLAPKKPWTIDKVPEEKMGALINAIVGFSVRFKVLQGKFKLSQNVAAEDCEGVIRGLIGRGDPASRAIARAMRIAKSSG